MPRLHKANTVAWGLLKWGMCSWMVIVHSVTRGWQDMYMFPPRMYGRDSYPYNTQWEVCLATLHSSERHHRLKNLPQKGGIVWTRRSGAPSWAGAVLISSISVSSRNSEQYRTVRSPSSHTRGVVASLYGGGRWTACALAHLSTMPCAHVLPSRRCHGGGMPPSLCTRHLAETRK